MIDIETLDTSNNAWIVSIGACRFGKEGVGKEFYRVCYKSQSGRRLNMETIVWWMRLPGDEARKVFKEKPVITLEQALKDLANFIDRKDNIWANGTNFDIEILQHAYNQFDLKVPWSYGKIRCLRSIRQLHPEYDIIFKEAPNTHNALYDAMNQAESLVKLTKMKGLSL